MIKAENHFKHIGILGMHWGRRKSPERITADNAKKLKKAQDEWDKKRRNTSNYIKAYNKAADYANNVLIPKINKKYGKYNWSSLDTSDPYNPKGDPKLVRSYKRYLKEYEKSFSDIFEKSFTELIGERPK